jgi:hypothetical protein
MDALESIALTAQHPMLAGSDQYSPIHQEPTSATDAGSGAAKNVRTFLTSSPPRSKHAEPLNTKPQHVLMLSHAALHFAVESNAATPRSLPTILLAGAAI